MKANQLFVIASLLGLFISQSVFSQTGGGTFQPGPLMLRQKIYPTATLLPNGKVISFGGREYNFVSCSYADVYDPVLNTFSELPMNFPHDAFATVKLSDGRYLLLGGGADLGIAPGYSSTEIYDPVSGTFTPMASMTMGRMQLAAAQLSNGKVLVAGAWYNPGGAATGEIYDISSNTFVPTGSLVEPRAFPVVIPTDDGGAVVTGGWPTYGGSSFSSVEYYQTPTNDYVSLSSELISAEPGWILATSYTKPVQDLKMMNGKYVFLAYRTVPALDYCIMTFDPASKQFARLNTQPLVDSLTSGGFIDIALNYSGNFLYLIGSRAGADPQQLALVACDLSTGQLYHPVNTFTLPSSEYFYPALTYIPSIGKILVQGINGSNSSYFTGTAKTYLISPDILSGIKQNDLNSALPLKVWANPAGDFLKFSFTTNTKGVMNISILDLAGKELYQQQLMTNEKEERLMEISLSNIESGVYILRVGNEEFQQNQKIVVAK